MLSVVGYTNLQSIYQGPESLVYRARRRRDDLPVILRQLREDIVSPSLKEQYRREFALLRSVRSTHVITALELLDQDGTLILVTEDIGGSALAQLPQPSINDVIRIAIDVVDGLDDLHAQYIVHKDICPGNLVLNPDTGQLKLIDLSIAAQTGPSSRRPEPGAGPEGTLLYMAPEQTGRLNRTLDYRADFYALGATLYELLTGVPPFDAEETLALIYSHVAVTPRRPAEINGQIPTSLSDIVMKLLEKMPEARYQSAHAIREDLKRCLELLNSGASATFEVALDDIPEQMMLSERLLERETQLQQLKTSFGVVEQGGTEVVVCYGRAGTGKSALIRELQKEVLAHGGLFVTARHNPLSPDRPFGAVSAACSDLVRQLQARADNESIRVRLNDALAENAAVITALVPELAPVLSPAPVTDVLPPVEARSRLLWGLTTIIQTLCSAEHPFVLTIESLHWIDKASLELFEPLISAQKISGLMILCSFRPEELSANSETRHVINRITASGAPVKLISLTRLSTQGIATLLSESFFRPVEDTLAFARVIEAKTGGNPLAVREFITSLGETGAVHFDRRHREWTWDIAAATNTAPTENVGMRLSERINDLEPATAQLLKIASCAGEDFDLETLSEVSNLSYPETSARLLNAVREGYIVQRPVDAAAPRRQLSYRFAHERIQQAAYALLPAAEKRQIHGQIGNVLLRGVDQAGDDQIFDIVNHLNNSISTPGGKLPDQARLASLNVAAGRRARAAGAFQAAFKYYRTAIALLGQHIWDRHDEAVALHLDTAESAYLCGDRHQVDVTIDTLLAHVRTPLERASALEIRLRALVAFEEVDTALALGDEVLGLLGVRIPKMGGLRFAGLICTLLYQVARINRNSVLQTNKMTDPALLAAMRVLMIMCQAGYINGSPQTGMYILRMTQLSMHHGLAPESSFAYPMFGALIITYLGTINAGYRFGMLAMQNIDDLNKALHCKSLTLVNNFISIWKHPVRNTLEPLSRAYQTGMETGDVEFALIAAITGSANAFLLGHDLNSLDASLARYNQEASEFNQTPMLGMGSIYQQAVRNLTRVTESPWRLKGDVYDEDKLISFHEASGDESSLANLYIVKLFLAVLFRQDAAALDYAARARQRLTSVVSSPALAFFILYESLAMIAQLGSATPIRAIKLNLRISYNQRLLRKWAHHAPSNILHSYHLVEAERCRIAGDNTSALEHFDLAITAATENGYLKEQAFANELAGRFHLNSGKRELALFYLRRARAAYTRWGAITKVRALDTEFVELGEDDIYTSRSRPLAATTSLQVQAGRDMRGYGDYLDLGSVIKASQVLAGEIILENLLERLMQVALENAGAQKAALVLSHNNTLKLEMTTTYRNLKSEHVKQEVPIEDTRDIPVSIVQYVARTREDLVLNDAMNEDIFTQDAYIVSNKPKSILCVPILSKAHLTGVLYLENMQTTLAFTKDRVAVLKLLASQSAIAIENARLYQQLNDSRNKYLSLYQNAVEGIFELDGDGLVTNVNPAAAHLMGFDSVEQAMRLGSFDAENLVVNRADADYLRRTLTEEHRVIGYELLIRRHDEATIWVAFSAQAFPDEADGNPGSYRIEGSIIDITERKLREDAEQATRIARAATESKSQFLANMSHEIRTPMNAIVGYTNLALKTPLSTQQASYLETIRNSSNHLLRVVNDILDLSKVESGKLELQHTPFRLGDIVSDLHNLFDLEAQEKGLALIVPEPDNAGDDFLIGDPVRIGQVLINLVSNALKFTDAGEIRVEFETVALKDQRVCINFAVSDTGIGIDESQLESIFDSFVQGNAPSREEGTGLGLSICKSLVEMMEGHIHAASSPGHGSQFYFSVIVEQGSENALPEPAGAPAQMEGQTLLLVEDNLINRRLAQEVLSQAGLNVVVASNGQEALEALEKQHFFAVLMDLRMPVMSGIEAIKLIRARPEFTALPTIALSAGVLQSEVDEAISSGFDHFLSKPVDFAELLALLRQIGEFDATTAEGQVLATAGATTRGTPSQPEQSQAEPSQVVIRGVDFGRALRNHGGDSALLASLMGEFINIYRFSDEELRALLQAADPVRAERLAHNVAGVAGSFGGMALMEAARELERGIRDSMPHLDDQLERFGRELINFLRALEQFQLDAQAPAAEG